MSLVLTGNTELSPEDFRALRDYLATPGSFVASPSRIIKVPFFILLFIGKWQASLNDNGLERCVMNPHAVPISAQTSLQKSGLLMAHPYLLA